MFSYFKNNARAKGFEIIDMHDAFSKAFRKDGRRFAFETDGHWNGYAHGLVTQQVESSVTFRSLFGVRG